MKELQVENGNFTRIVNKLLEEFAKLPLSGAEFSVLLFIMRKIYGFNKPFDEISLSQFVLGTNRSKPTVIKALKNLQLVNILILVSKGNSRKSSNVYRLNKYYETWKLVNLPKLVKDRKLTSKEKLKKLVNIPLHTKEITKDNTKESVFPFITLWELLPTKARVGKKVAIRHFNATVKTEKDYADIQTALKNYLASERVSKGYVQNASTWFNNWKDWVDYKEVTKSEPLTDHERNQRNIDARIKQGRIQ